MKLAVGQRIPAWRKGNRGIERGGAVGGCSKDSIADSRCVFATCNPTPSPHHPQQALFHPPAIVLNNILQNSRSRKAGTLPNRNISKETFHFKVTTVPRAISFFLPLLPQSPLRTVTSFHTICFAFAFAEYRHDSAENQQKCDGISNRAAFSAGFHHRYSCGG